MEKNMKKDMYVYNRVMLLYTLETNTKLYNKFNYNSMRKNNITMYSKRDIYLLYHLFFKLLVSKD